MKFKLFKSVLILLLFCNFQLFAQYKILFDAKKAEMCSNADWVIDADAHNIYFSSTTHLPYASTGSSGQSNPQRFPTPAQSGITSTTAETYWDGALSAWAIDCVKQGYTVETLPFLTPLTYGTNAAQDLINYKVFVVDEPNIPFTADEKTAIMNFVANGGGLMMIADHFGSDRNFDNFDSPMIWNDLMSSNTLLNDAFGMTFDLIDTNNISTTNFPNLPTNTILHGIAGNVTQVKFYSGTTIKLDPTKNSSVLGLVFKTGSSNTGSLNALVASATFQNGKVVAIGDSSIEDDGTGDPGDSNLIDGYTVDAGGSHRKLLMNAIIWLMTSNTAATNENSFDASHFTVAPNPTHDKQLHFTFNLDEVQNTTISLYDTLGRLVKQVQLNELNSGINYQNVDATDLQSGMYIAKLSNQIVNKSLRVTIK